MFLNLLLFERLRSWGSLLLELNLFALFINGGVLMLKIAALLLIAIGVFIGIQYGDEMVSQLDSGTETVLNAIEKLKG